MRAKIIGTGSYLPQTIATNDYLSTIMDTNDEWIQSRTGIRQRHLVQEETTSAMAAAAGRQALEMAGLQPEEIQMIIVATVSSDYLVPSTACMIQKELGAANAMAFDINAACSGFLFALNIADTYIQSGACTNALVLGAETLSKIVDWNDRSTCVLFGDGAGAAVVTAKETGYLAGVQGSDGARGHVLQCKSRGNCNPFHQDDQTIDYLSMDGQEVFRFAVKKVPECILEVLAKADVAPEDVDCYVLHQANQRILTSIAKRLKLPMEKFPANLDQCGNTSAASVPILLDQLNRQGVFHSGDKILLAGFGAGLTWGAALIQW